MKIKIPHTGKSKPISSSVDKEYPSQYSNIKIDSVGV